MSDLQIVLIVIGALIIAAVLILNWWQERRFHQQVESNFSNLQSDALLDDPKLDASKLYEEVDAFSSNTPIDDDFTITQHEPAKINLESFVADTADSIAFNEYDSLNKESIEEVYTETVYTELTHKTHELSHHSETSHPVTTESVEIKPAQHEEIKAIFDEVFSNTSASNVVDITNGARNEESGLTHTKIAVDEPVLSLPAMLHAQMDLTAVLFLASEATVTELGNALNGLFDGYEKPVYLHLLDSNKQWVLLQDAAKAPSQSISRLACSLQLADRAGAVSRNMLNRFQLAVETLG